MKFQLWKASRIAICVVALGVCAKSADAETAQPKTALTPDTFRTKVLATFGDMNTELTEARIVVPARLPNSAAQADKDTVLQERSDIIFARLVLGYELTGNFRVFGNLLSLQKLIAARPKGDTEFPNLTVKKLAALNALYKLASPSYVIGRSSKSRWAQFATHLTNLELNPT